MKNQITNLYQSDDDDWGFFVDMESQTIVNKKTNTNVNKKTEININTNINTNTNINYDYYEYYYDYNNYNYDDNYNDTKNITLKNSLKSKLKNCTNKIFKNMVKIGAQTVFAVSISFVVFCIL